MAVAKIQNVKFEVYVCYKRDENDKECTCDIYNLLKDIKKLSSKDKITHYMGEQIRMDGIFSPTLSSDRANEMGEDKLIYMHMSKLRKDGIAITSINETDLEDLPLDDDEYVAEDIGMIFDTAFRSICIQRNFHSLSITGVAYYLNKMYSIIHNDKKKSIPEIYFKPVCDKNVINRIKKIDNFRKIELSYASQYDKPSSKTMLRGILPPLKDAFSGLNGENVTISITAKRMTTKDSNSLNTAEIEKIIEDVYENDGYFNKAIITGKEGDAPVELYDLLNGKLVKKIKFSTIKKNKRVHLRPDSVREKLLDEYFDSKPSFRKEIGDNLN